MVKHNNVVPNAHFHKDWQSYVKTWFNQPAKKVARRNARVAKAAAVAPRPLNLLRPAVRGQTLKYNNRVRAGRGFTLDELKVRFFFTLFFSFSPPSLLYFLYVHVTGLHFVGLAYCIILGVLLILS